VAKVNKFYLKANNFNEYFFIPGKGLILGMEKRNITIYPKWDKSGNTTHRLFIGNIKFGFVRTNDLKARGEKGNDYIAVCTLNGITQKFDTPAEAKAFLEIEFHSFLSQLTNR